MVAFFLRSQKTIMSDEEGVVTTLKFIVVGDSGAGKSSLLVRFIEDTFDPDQGPTIGVDFKAKVITSHGNKVKLTVWDTAGQDRFRTLTASYYRGAHGAVLVYDVARRESFEHVMTWLNEVDVYATNQNMVKMLIGNKIDLERQVSTEEGLKFAQENSMLFIECSAKTKKGVQQAFEELTQKVLDTPDLWSSSSAKPGGVSLTKGSDEHQSCGQCVV
eukprot:m.42660 g.42660  ORF g.42660 m.42660 type:complete len:217 (-) comp14358_c0_seq1:124-774(-)